MLSINHSIFFIAFSTVLYVFFYLFTFYLLENSWKLFQRQFQFYSFQCELIWNFSPFELIISHQQINHQWFWQINNAAENLPFVFIYACVCMYNVHIVIKKANRIRVHIRTRQMRVDTIISFDGMSCEIVCILFVPLTLFLRTIGSWLCVRVFIIHMAKLCVRDIR